MSEVVASAIPQPGDKVGAAGRAHAVATQAFLIMRDRSDVDRAAIPDAIGDHVLASACINDGRAVQNAASGSALFPASYQ